MKSEELPKERTNGDKPAADMTKREFIAAAAMQGLITSHPDQVHNQIQGVTVAIAWADELLKQLEHGSK